MPHHGVQLWTNAHGQLCNIGLNFPPGSADFSSFLAAHRLLHDLMRAENALSFWNHRLDHNEGQVRFLLLGQGPVAFVKAMQALAHKNSNELASSATSKIERRVCCPNASHKCPAFIALD